MPDSPLPSPADAAAAVWRREKAADFRGPDPYDALNGRLLAPVLRGPAFLRLLATQAVLRCPFDPRRLLAVPPGRNPKALALFLRGILDLPSADPDPGAAACRLQEMLMDSARLADGSPVDPQAAGGRGFGWGYDFPWQGRAFFQPAGHPTVVCTCFVLDALAESRHPALPALVEGAAELVRKSTGRYECEHGACFSYSPRDSTRVYNASLFAARILARSCGEDPSRTADGEAAREAARFVASRQGPDGSWVYGEAPHWQWIDNIHTGFVLESLIVLGRALGTDEWRNCVRRGLDFYAGELFVRDGTALSGPGRRYPQDPHAFAQGILTWLSAVQDGLEASVDPSTVARRALETLWDRERSGFLLRRTRWDGSRTIYTRWSQAWMFRALSALSGSRA
jgi:hypothetical protein